MVKITVNGVAYDSVEAMPADVRRVYEQAMAKLPGLADRDGDGIPDIAQGDGLSVRQGTTVRKRFIVSGATYDDVDAMPPDVRQAYERAVQAVSSGAAKVTRNEIKMSFKVTGPGMSLHQRSAAPFLPQPPRPVAQPVATPQPVVRAPTPSPIESGASEGRLRMALTLGACAAAALLIWLVLHGR